MRAAHSEKIMRECSVPAKGTSCLFTFAGRAIPLLLVLLFLTGCGVSLVSRKYAEQPVQPLNAQAAVAEINAYRKANGVRPVVLDARLSRSAALHSFDLAKRGRVSHSGSDGSGPKVRARRAGYRAKIASENVAGGQKSFSDAMFYWKRSRGHRRNLLRANVTAAGVGMAQTQDQKAYWTLVLGRE
jgi:uncharacterized protein YkwD